MAITIDFFDQMLIC